MAETKTTKATIRVTIDIDGMRTLAYEGPDESMTFETVANQLSVMRGDECVALFAPGVWKCVDVVTTEASND